MSAQAADQHPELWTQLESSLVFKRLQGYGLFSRAVDLVGKAKENSSTIKSAVDLSSMLGGRLLAASQPVLQKVDQYTKLDERGDQVLALLEKRASDVYTRVAELERQRQTVVNTSIKAVTRPLDTVIQVIDKYIPEEEGDIPSEAEPAPKPYAEVEEEELLGEVEMPSILRTSGLTTTTKLAVISNKLRRGVVTTFGRVKSRSEEQLRSIKFAADMLDYSAKYIDSLQLAEFGGALMHQAQDKMARFNDYVSSNEQLQQIHSLINPVVSTLKTGSQRALFASLTTLSVIFDLTSARARTLWFSMSVKNLEDSVKRVSHGVKIFVRRLDAQTVHHMLELAKTARWVNDVIQTQRQQIVAGTYNYINSLKVVAEIQRRIRDVLQRTAGVLPSQFLSGASNPVPHPNHDQKL